MVDAEAGRAPRWPIPWPWPSSRSRPAGTTLPDRLLDRLEALEPRPELVQQVPWTPAEWRRQLARRNPIAVESLDRGVWVCGTAASIEGESC